MRFGAAATILEITYRNGGKSNISYCPFMYAVNSLANCLGIGLVAGPLSNF
jgi:hypothetical protein